MPEVIIVVSWVLFLLPDVNAWQVQWQRTDGVKSVSFLFFIYFSFIFLIPCSRRSISSHAKNLSFSVVSYRNDADRRAACVQDDREVKDWHRLYDDILRCRQTLLQTGVVKFPAHEEVGFLRSAFYRSATANFPHSVSIYTTLCSAAGWHCRPNLCSR